MANATIAPITASATTGSVHRRTSLRSCCGCTAPDDLLLAGWADPARHPQWADHGRFGHKECEYKRVRGGYDGGHGAEQAEALAAPPLAPAPLSSPVGLGRRHNPGGGGGIGVPHPVAARPCTPTPLSGHGCLSEPRVGSNRHSHGRPAPVHVLSHGSGVTLEIGR